MPASPRILVIEDDRNLLLALTMCLKRAGFRVIEARDGEQGIKLALHEQPDLLLLDVMLPGISGFTVAGELRRVSFDRPILMLTGQSHVEDRVAGLGAGADDYLTKPFDERELLARIHALLRRQQRPHATPASVALDDVVIDFEKRVATKAGAALALTKTEFALLELLAKNAGRPVSKKTILDAVWNYTRTPDTRTVDTHVWRLRKKIGDSGTQPRWITRVAGQGYCLMLPQPARED